MAKLTQGTTPIKLVQTANGASAVDTTNPDLVGALVFLKENGISVGQLVKDGVVYGDDYLTSAISGTVKIGGVNKTVTYAKGTLIRDVIKDILLGNNANIPVKSTQVYDTTQGKAQHTINAETKTALADLKTSFGSALHYRGTVSVPVVDSEWYNHYSEGYEVQVAAQKLLKPLRLNQTTDTALTIKKTGYKSTKVELVVGQNDSYDYCESFETIETALEDVLNVVDITSQVTITSGTVTINPKTLEAWLRGGTRNGYNPGTRTDITVGAFILSGGADAQKHLVRLPAPDLSQYAPFAKGDVFNTYLPFMYEGALYPAGTNVAFKDDITDTALISANIDPLGGTIRGMVSREELNKMDYQTEQEVDEMIEHALMQHDPLSAVEHKKLEFLGDELVTSVLLTTDILSMNNQDWSSDPDNAVGRKVYYALTALETKKSPIWLNAGGKIVSAECRHGTVTFMTEGKLYKCDFSPYDFNWRLRGLDINNLNERLTAVEASSVWYTFE